MIKTKIFKFWDQNETHFMIQNPTELIGNQEKFLKQAVSMLIVCCSKRLSTNVTSCEMLSLTPCLKYGLSMRPQKIVELQKELKAFCHFNGLFSYFIFNIIICYSHYSQE